MSDSEDSLTQDHLKLVESIDRRANSIYKQLCEYEETLESCTLDNSEDSQTKIMDLLETVETIQEAADFLRSHNLRLRSKQTALENQMKCLELSVDLLKLECGPSVGLDNK